MSKFHSFSVPSHGAFVLSSKGVLRFKELTLDSAQSQFDEALDILTSLSNISAVYDEGKCSPDFEEQYYKDWAKLVKIFQDPAINLADLLVLRWKGSVSCSGIVGQLTNHRDLVRVPVSLALWTKPFVYNCAGQPKEMCLFNTLGNRSFPASEDNWCELMEFVFPRSYESLSLDLRAMNDLFISASLRTYAVLDSIARAFPSIERSQDWRDAKAEACALFRDFRDPDIMFLFFGRRADQLGVCHQEEYEAQIRARVLVSDSNIHYGNGEFSKSFFSAIGMWIIAKYFSTSPDCLFLGTYLNVSESEISASSFKVVYLDKQELRHDAGQNYVSCEALMEAVNG